jgi:hypothetical protein
MQTFATPAVLLFVRVYREPLRPERAGGRGAHEATRSV